MGETEPRKSNSRLLIVEDDRAQLRTLTDIMEAEGFEVVACSTAAEALEHLLRDEIGVAVVDLRLPDLSGTQLLEKLQSLKGRVHAVIHTGHGSYQSAKDALNLGAFAYVEKAGDPNQLVHHVHRAFQAHLQRYAEDLESAVARRTRELEEACQELKQEISVRKRAEDELRASERARAEAEKLAATGRIAARVAHEINNPLASIKSGFQLVKSAVPEGHPDLQFAELIEKEIDRIARIVARMYELHRPQQETVCEVRVEQAIDEVVTMMAPIARESQIRIENRTPRPTVIVRIPEGSLRQVLYNLLANAVEASPPGAAVTIAATLADDTVAIAVTDRGSGIAGEHRHRVFEPFFTTKSRETTGGLGLGLSISKGIVEALGGSLDFESEPGQGTVFRVILPTQPP